MTDGEDLVFFKTFRDCFRSLHLMRIRLRFRLRVNQWRRTTDLEVAVTDWDILPTSLQALRLDGIKDSLPCWQGYGQGQGGVAGWRWLQHTNRAK